MEAGEKVQGESVVSETEAGIFAVAPSTRTEGGRRGGAAFMGWSRVKSLCSRGAGGAGAVARCVFGDSREERREVMAGCFVQAAQRPAALCKLRGALSRRRAQRFLYAPEALLRLFPLARRPRGRRFPCSGFVYQPGRKTVFSMKLT